MKIAGLGTFSKIFAYLGDSENKNSGTIPRANKIHICIFFHPDYTVGIGITPIRRLRVRGLYRRWGISPRPENKRIHYNAND